MELDSRYAAEVRDRLGFFPVWPPGDAIAPGDVGTVRNGIFRREGTLSDLIAGIDLQVTSQAISAPTRFRSAGVTASQVKAAGGAPVEPGIDAKGEVTITFGQSGGVAFDAERCEEAVISNMLLVRSAIEARSEAWKPGYVMVSRVTTAQAYTVIVAAQSGASLVLKGSADALKSWNLAKAGISVAESNFGGYQRSGDGPILLGLYGFDWMLHLGGGAFKPKALTEAPPSDDTFVELSARNPAFDPA